MKSPMPNDGVFMRSPAQAEPGGLFSMPPAQQHSQTSVAASQTISPRTPTMRQMVLNALLSHSRGMTDEELHRHLLSVLPAAKESSIRARRCELTDAGLVVDSGVTRAGASGAQMVVWRAKGDRK